jgi:hypothetical protein
MYFLKSITLLIILSSSAFALDAKLYKNLKAISSKNKFNEILVTEIQQLDKNISKRKEELIKKKSKDRTIFEREIETQVALERLLELSQKNINCSDAKELMIFHYSPKNLKIEENKLPVEVQEVLKLLPIYCKLQVKT